MKRFYGIVLLWLTATQLFAQTDLPGRCEVWLPKRFYDPVTEIKSAYGVMTKPYGQYPAPAAKDYWTVYSDRDNNTTYTQPKNGAPKFDELSFDEQLVIASIKNGYALVYSVGSSKDFFPNIPSNARSRGWISLNNLVLWRNALGDEAGVSYKAVICANLNASGNDAEGKLFRSPTGKPVDNLKTNMRFYYVMKEEGSKALLGYYNTNESSNAQVTRLYGWVDTNSYVPWNYRTCLEPTWENSDVEWFSKNQKKWQVYVDKNKRSGKPAAEGSYTTSKARNTSEYRYRTMSPYQYRFPILEGCTDKLYHCSTFGTTGTKSSMPDTDADMQVAMANLNNAKVVNIGIVIDGTSSMKPYFASVKNAIVEGCKYFGASAHVNVAVAIYRDKEDGAYILETFPSAGGFTENPNNQNLKKFLDTGGKYGVKSVARDETESVYYGIKTAVEKFNFNPRQSNLLLVVGDCGDNGKMGVRREELIDLLAEKRISLMAFQVRNKKSDAYQTFNTQMTYIMRQSLQQRFDSQAAARGNKSQKAAVNAVPLNDGSGWDIYNEHRVGRGKDIDLYRYVHRRNPVLNKDMDVNELTALMENTIAQWNERIQYLQARAIEVIDDTGFQANEDGTGTITDAIVELLGGDNARFERIRQKNTTVSFRGWTDKRDPASNRAMYKVVVFLPGHELKALVQSLAPVYKVARERSNDRRPYYEAMTQLAGMLVAQERIKDVKYKEILARAFGLDAATADLGGPSLADIIDPNIVSQEKYMDLLNNMVKSYEKLQNVLGEDYPFKFTFAATGEVFYWLPSEHLPL